MKFFKETEKAVQVKMVLDYYCIERDVYFPVWIPKSQFKNGLPTAWILNQKKTEFAKPNYGGCNAYFYDAEGKEIESYESTQRDKAFQAGCDNYNRLIAIAKENNIKGIRVGLRRATIEQKLTMAGIAF